MTPKKQETDPARPSALIEQYNQLVATGHIKDNSPQREVLVILQELSDQLTARKNKGIKGIFQKKQKPDFSGVYVWGNVGRGKSMLMDLFFNTLAIEKKRRVHFHAFMQEIHHRIHQLRQEAQRGKSGDPVAILSAEIAQQTQLLCFDELQAPDVADATLLYRLFSSLFEAGIVIVSTSNRPPKTLYTGGVQKERFDKFVALIEEKMQIVALSSDIDFRLGQLKSLQKTYFWPLNRETDDAIERILQSLCANPIAQRASVHIKGRDVHYTVYDGAIGRFSFNELCVAALGPADYLALAQKLDTIILTGIPKLSAEKRNEAKRFVTLIDVLYEQKVKLICSAAVSPQELYTDGDGTFEFQRTVSRLMEMQSAKWMDNG